MSNNRKKASSTVSSVRLGRLIENLGPINNECRAADGIRKVELMWDLGDAVLAGFPDGEDQVLWAISARSYITRDLLRYALIVRRNWADRSELRKTFPTLTHFTLFREALPFLKGDRCKISDDVYSDIVSRLNSGEAIGKIKAFILALKAKKMGRKHHKGQAKARMAGLANTVRSAVSAVFNVAIADDLAVESLRQAAGDDALLRLSQWLIAAAEEVPFDGQPIQSLPEPVALLSDALIKVGNADRDDRAGFRRSVGVKTLMEGAALLNAIRSEAMLRQWRALHGSTVQLQGH